MTFESPLATAIFRKSHNRHDKDHASSKHLLNGGKVLKSFGHSSEVHVVCSSKSSGCLGTFSANVSGSISLTESFAERVTQTMAVALSKADKQTDCKFLIHSLVSCCATPTATRPKSGTSEAESCDQTKSLTRGPSAAVTRCQD